MRWPADRAFDDARQYDHSTVWIEPRVEHQRLKAVTRLALGRGNPLHDGLKHVRHACAGLGADRQRMRGIETDGAL